MSTFTGIPRDAGKVSGGIDYVLLADYNVSNIKGTLDNSTGLVTFTADASLNTLFTKFVPRKETSNYTSTLAATASGSSNYNQVLTLVFSKNSIVVRNQLAIMKDKEMIAVIVDRAGNNVVFGLKNGLDSTAEVGTSGTAPTDLNAATLTLAGNEPYRFGNVTDAVLATLQ